MHISEVCSCTKIRILATAASCSVLHATVDILIEGQVLVPHIGSATELSRDPGSLSGYVLAWDYVSRANVTLLAPILFWLLGAGYCSLLMQALETTDVLIQYCTAGIVKHFHSLCPTRALCRPCPGHTHDSMSILSRNHDHL